MTDARTFRSVSFESIVTLQPSRSTSTAGRLGSPVGVMSVRSSHSVSSNMAKNGSLPAGKSNSAFKPFAP